MLPSPTERWAGLPARSCRAAAARTVTVSLTRKVRPESSRAAKKMGITAWMGETPPAFMAMISRCRAALPREKRAPVKVATGMRYGR